MARRAIDLAVSAEPVVAVDAELRVVSWNAQVEELTGLLAHEALGEPCWLVLRGRSRRGSVLCHRDCSVTRYAREGHGPPLQEMTIATTSGRRTVWVSTVIIHDHSEPLLVHILRDDVPRDAGRVAGTRAAQLTPRQVEVLRLLADGVAARAIATRLGVAETTARNHIRAVLVELGAHSQLEAVARARALGLV